ncbi:MAG: GNAT family N-acetyltransferase [Pyrinomonadaceae bacterium]
MIEIETSRLQLRQLTPGDLDDLHPIFSDPAVVKYMKTGSPVSRDETETALDSIIKHWETHGFGRWAVVLKETGKLIGYGGLRNLYGTPELVYLLAQPYWGMGIATEVAQACLKWGFDERPFERIVAVTRPEHAASRRVMEKIGMVYERNVIYHDIDVVLYSISRATHRSLTVLEEIPLACMADNNPRQNPPKRSISTEA